MPYYKLTTMAYLESADNTAKLIDKGLTNVFKWAWLEEEVSYVDWDKNEQRVKISSVIKKCNKRG